MRLVPRSKKLLIGLPTFLVVLVTLVICLPSHSENGILLGTLGGDWSNAVDVNDTGQVVGNSLTKDRKAHIFLWTKETGMQDLDIRGYATSIDDQGRILGSFRTGNGDSHAFVWTRKTGITDLGTIGELSSTAHGYTEDGAIYGTAHGQGINTFIPFIWTEETGIRETSAYPATHRSRTINNAGQGINNYFTAVHACIATKDGKTHKLSLLGEYQSIASAINNNGQVAGYVLKLPWWVKIWNWLGQTLKLPDKYCPKLSLYIRKEAALWTVPPDEPKAPE